MVLQGAKPLAAARMPEPDVYDHRMTLAPHRCEFCDALRSVCLFFHRSTAIERAMPGQLPPNAQAGHASGAPDARPPGRFARWSSRLFGNPSVVIVANAVAQSMLRLASNIVLAQLLAPAAFAMTAIVLLILTGIQMISDMGIGVMALRDGEMDDAREARLWTIHFTRGLTLAAVVFLLSEPIAWLYGIPQLGEVMRVLCLMPALQGLQSLYGVLALARRDLSPMLVMDLGGRVVGTAVSIGVALMTPTVWALVAGTLAQFIWAAAASHVMSGRRQRFVLDFAFFQSQWRFSRWIQLSSTFTFISGQADKALFPFLFGLPTFGLYVIGATFAAVPAQVTLRWSSSVFYPLTAQLFRNGEEARRLLRHVRMTMLIYSAIIVVTVMAGAPSFFFLLYKPEYHEAARFAQLLAAGTFFEIAELSLRQFPLVDDTSRFEVLSVMLRLLTFAALVGTLQLAGVGADGYAASYVAAMAVGYLFMLWTCVRRGYLRPGPDLLVIAPVVLAQCVAFLIPLPEPRIGTVLVGGAIVALAAAALTTLVYLRRGLPSLPRIAAPEVLREEGERETGESPVPL